MMRKTFDVDEDNQKIDEGTNDNDYVDDSNKQFDYGADENVYVAYNNQQFYDGANDHDYVDDNNEQVVDGADDDDNEKVDEDSDDDKRGLNHCIKMKMKNVPGNKGDVEIDDDRAIKNCVTATTIKQT